MTEVTYYETLLQEDVNWGTGTAVKRNPGGGFLVGTQMGIHSMAVGQAAFTANWVPGAITSLTSAEVDVAAQGASMGDFVLVSYEGALNGLILSAEVSAAGVVTARLFNPTTATINQSVSKALRILVLKSR